MLKFQENYTTDHISFEDFLLVIFVFVDDLGYCFRLCQIQTEIR